MQMLGKSLEDPHNLEGGYASTGLNLLGIKTTLEAEKTNWIRARKHRRHVRPRTI